MSDIMTFRIVIKLPADRTQEGILVLYRDDLTVSVMRCLGKADNQRAAEAGNPHRDPILPYGDTPLGAYAPASLEILNPPHPRMGSYVIPLTGIGGDAKAAMAARAGLAIHAGRGDERLVPTYGCVRLLDRDIEGLRLHLDGARIDAIEIVPLIMQGISKIPHAIGSGTPDHSSGVA